MKKQPCIQNNFKLLKSDEYYSHKLKWFIAWAYDHI